MNINIFQTFYSKDIIPFLDEGFTRYDNLKNPLPYEREFYIQKKIHKEIQEDSLTGLFSPKFNDKANITSKEVYDFINQNPGHDIYLFNPFPTNAYYTYNVWDHAEIRHPGIYNKVLRYIPKELLFNKEIKDFGRIDPTLLVYCSFWVGNKKVWDEYMDFMIPIYDWLLKQDIFQDKKYICNVFKISYFPYIMERLMSTFLMEKKDFKVKAYKYPQEKVAKQNDLDFLEELYLKVKDAIDIYDNNCVRSREEFYKITTPYTDKKYKFKGYK